jgi:hypothetical protein
MQSEHLPTRSIRTDRSNKRQTVGFVRDAAYIDYIYSELKNKSPKINKELFLNNYSWRVDEGETEQKWIEVKNINITSKIRDEDILIAGNPSEAIDLLTKRLNKNLAEEEKSIFSPADFKVEKNYLSTRIATQYKENELEDNSINNIIKDKVYKDLGIRTELLGYDVEISILEVENKKILSEKANPIDVINYIKKTKNFVQADWKTTESVLKIKRGETYSSEYEGIIYEGPYKVTYDLKKWKSRKAYYNKPKTKTAKIKAKTKILAGDASRIYYSLLNSFMKTGKRRFDKAKKKETRWNRGDSCQWNNYNNPLEEFIMTWRKPYHIHKLSSAADYFRRCYKLLIALRTHGSLDKRKQALFKPEMIKLMEDIHWAIKKINLTKRPKSKSSKYMIWDSPQQPYGYYGCIFLRYYKMFLAKEYESRFTKPKSKGK